MDIELLSVLSENCRLSDAQIAVMLGRDEEEIRREIQEMEKKDIILGYPALIDWEKTERDVVTAFIEVRVTPQRGQGFDRVAEKIYQYPQVKSCYLMSGGFDLFVTVEGKSMKEVALFVAEKLAPIESVLSTSTHFVLKKYKEKGVIYEQKYTDNREAVVL